MPINCSISFNINIHYFGCTFVNYSEQKARATYEKLIDLCRDNPDVVDPLRFLREREVVHFQRFGEALRGVQDKLAEKKFYMNDGSCLDMQQNDCNC
ncbi:MAG: hypothetical protein BHW02_01055 [Clostridium sp. 28_12]|nr:MAG: hypothetical protein BHW02_01055 [Clostridium sp. 28_12]